MALPTAEHDRALGEVRRVLATLQFGAVTLIVQDGRVVQVDTTTRVRLAAPTDTRTGRGG
jgi:hypothetical protein